MSHVATIVSETKVLPPTNHGADKYHSALLCILKVS